MKTYLIEYSCFDEKGNLIKNGKIKGKKAQNGVHAQTQLEIYLKNKYSNFNNMIVHSCDEQNIIDDIFDQFGSAFNNPFNFKL